MANRDKHESNSLAYAIVTLQGAGVLFPWNAVVNAVDYFDGLYGTDSYEFYVALAYILPQLVVVGLMVKFGQLVSFNVRIVSMYLFQAGVLVLIPLVAQVASVHISYWFTLLAVFIIGVSTSILQPSIFGFTGQLPPLFTQAIMAGQGVAGVGVSALRIVTKLSVPNSQTNALIFFGLGCGVLIVCVVAYLYLVRMEFTKYHLSRSATMMSMQTVAAETDSQTAPLLSGASDDVRADSRSDNPKLQRLLDAEAVTIANDAPFHADTHRVVHREAEPGTWPYYWNITKQVAIYGIGACSVFVVTFAVFPGEISEIPYRNTLQALTFANKIGWPIVLIAVFNVLDLTGRSAASRFQLFGEKTVLIPIVLRLVFVPLFILAVHNSFFSDPLTLIMVAVYAITNGHLASVCMMLGPTKVPAHQRETAGFIMTLFLQSGIFVGAFVAMGVNKIQ